MKTMKINITSNRECVISQNVISLITYLEQHTKISHASTLYYK